MTSRTSVENWGTSLTIFSKKISVLQNAFLQILLAVLLSSCSAVFHDSSSGTTPLDLSNNTPANLPWGDEDTIRTNKNYFTIDGLCGTNVDKMTLVITHPNHADRSIESECEDSRFSLVIPSDNPLPENGEYEFAFQGHRANGRALGEPLLRTVDLWYRNISGDFTLDAAFYDGMIVVDSDLDLYGLCSALTDIEFSASSGSFIFVGNCEKGSTWNASDILLSLGANIVNLQWSDAYGNEASRTLSVNYQLPGAALLTAAGMTSGSTAGLVPQSAIPNRARIYWSSVLPLVAAENTTQPNPLTIENNEPAVEGWLIPGVFGRIVNNP